LELQVWLDVFLQVVVAVERTVAISAVEMAEMAVEVLVRLTLQMQMLEL
jgi:hypothetical protein